MPSLSARRAWIEILCDEGRAAAERQSLSARRAWIEMTYVTRLPRAQVSLSARRAWIEIVRGCWFCVKLLVALRKESVDRNTMRRDFKALGLVALRKESVDRNTNFSPASLFGLPSLSARRAWIEIPVC